jgi:hypothetical protein
MQKKNDVRGVQREDSAVAVRDNEAIIWQRTLKLKNN